MAVWEVRRAVANAGAVGFILWRYMPVEFLPDLLGGHLVLPRLVAQEDQLEGLSPVGSQWDAGHHLREPIEAQRDHLFASCWGSRVQPCDRAWHEYRKGRQMVAIRVRSDDLVAALGNSDASIGGVVYADGTDYEARVKSASARMLAYHKSKQWAWEQEVRIVDSLPDETEPLIALPLDLALLQPIFFVAPDSTDEFVEQLTAMVRPVTGGHVARASQCDRGSCSCSRYGTSDGKWFHFHR